MTGLQFRTITVVGRELQAAVCPVCYTRCYPPESVNRCIERHEVVARQQGLTFCYRCHRHKPKGEFRYAARTCDPCFDAAKKQGGPPRGRRADGKNPNTEYYEWLSDKAYSWE